ncbi:hypothetical protein ACFWUU_04235 [Kribbella sp. NPDC058693]|uniref:hypothetical protein n=1 Tax=Kribbella sp. NPDC058693 TaxID=3346602 RepID=UPI00365114A4
MFSATRAATVTVFDGDLNLPGATANARLRRVQKSVDEVMRHVTDGYKPSLQKLTPNGSDILGEYQEAGSYIRELGTSYVLDFLLLTDGYQAAGDVNLGGSPLSRKQATALAARLDVPKLPGSTVTVAGIGQVAAGKPASTAIVNGTIALWEEICRRSSPTRCVIVTDLSLGR